MVIKSKLKKEINANIFPIVLLALGAVAIFVIQIININHIYGPTIIYDEIGYWGAAAHFNGVDWSDVMVGSPYYAYGYGLLISPIFLLVKSPLLMYRIAIILNIIFVTMCLFIAYHTLLLLAENTNKNILAVIAFASVFTTNNIYHSQIAWAESSILFLTWVIVDIVTHMLIKATNEKLVALAIISSFIFFVHQRTIGITVVVFLFIVYMAVEKKISKKQMVGFISVFLLAFIFGLIIKNNIQNSLYDANIATKSDVNDVAGISNGILSYFKACIKGERSVAELFAGFAGKWFYFGTASYMLIYFSIYYTLKCLKKILRKEKCNRKYIVLMLFVLFFLAELIISTLYMLNCSRNDGIYYGRYTEITLGPIIAITLLLLNEEGIRFKHYAVVGALGFILQWFFAVWSHDILWNPKKKFWDTMAPAITNLIFGDGVIIGKTFKLFFIIMVVYALFVGKKHKLGNICVILMILFTIWNYDEMLFYYNSTQGNTHFLIDTYNSAVEQYGEENVYYYMEENSYNQYDAAILQFFVKDKKVKKIYIDEVKNGKYKNAVIIVFWTSRELDYFVENFNTLSTGDVYLFK